MSSADTQSSLCKSVCWLIGAVIGAYAAYALVTDYGSAPVLSAVIGIVAMLLIGLVLRRLFCRKTPSRVEEQPAVAKPPVKVNTATANSKGAAPSEAGLPRFDAPKADTLDRELDARVNKAASEISQVEAMETEAKAVAEKPETPAISAVQPKAMDAPEDGQGDDLGRITDLGAAEIAALNGAGIYYYSQLVALNRRELAWIDQNIATNGAAAQAWRKQAIALQRTQDAAQDDPAQPGD